MHLPRRAPSRAPSGTPKAVPTSRPPIPLWPQPSTAGRSMAAVWRLCGVVGKQSFATTVQSKGKTTCMDSLVASFCSMLLRFVQEYSLQYTFLTSSCPQRPESKMQVTNFEVEQANPIIGGVQVGKTILWCTHHICHAVSTDHETIIALLILRLDVVTSADQKKSVLTAFCDIVKIAATAAATSRHGCHAWLIWSASCAVRTSLKWRSSRFFLQPSCRTKKQTAVPKPIEVVGKLSVAPWLPSNMDVHSPSAPSNHQIDLLNGSGVLISAHPYSWINNNNFLVNLSKTAEVQCLWPSMYFKRLGQGSVAMCWPWAA